MESTCVLLVEDNPDDEALTLRALKKNSITAKVVVAHDGVEALEYLRQFADADPGPDSLPALVLLDLKLPKVDGIEVLQRMRDQGKTRRIPVVVLTTSLEEKDLARCYDSGANSYLRKPVDFTQFMSLIKEVALYWLALNERPPAE